MARMKKKTSFSEPVTRKSESIIVPRKRQIRSNHARYSVAHEAARLMREHGIKDYLLAKRKAADRLGVTDRTSLPGNDEIIDALTEQQRLFGGDEFPLGDRLGSRLAVVEAVLELGDLSLGLHDSPHE